MDASHSSQMHESGTETEAKDNLDSLVANSICRLTIEAGFDSDFVHLPYFEGMINLLTRGVRTAMPTYEHILQMLFREVQQRERALKQQWERNGCSVILDRWNGRCGGENFISVLVHCSKGMLFLRSVDISTIIDDVDELASMVCAVIDDIGVSNIIHIITNDASPYMQAAEHAVLKKHGQSFSFTLCADYCINLLLQNIAALDHVSGVLTKARNITRFIYSHALPMELEEYIPGGEILSNSNLEYVAMFLTLERLVSQRANLVEMFSSPEWTSSNLASTNLSRQICQIIQSDNAFWCAAAEVLKLTGPIVGVLFKLETDNCSMGVLYDAMDNTKDEIKQNLGPEHGSYWKMIDRIWDNYLHSSLHAAGYLLNPKIFYSAWFHGDDEIINGIVACTNQVSKSRFDALSLAGQLDSYQRKYGLFGSDTAAREAMEIPQGTWWFKHGAETKELQSLANRILSQTCFGASRYNIDNSLSERLHTEKRTYSNQEKFRKLEYIHYNFQLRNSVPRLGGPSEGQHGHGKLTAKLGDWIRAERPPGCLISVDD